MRTPNARLKRVFEGLLRVAITPPTAFPPPPMTRDDFPDYVSYLRALIGHEKRTRKSCEATVKILAESGGRTLRTDGRWERYFLDMRIQAALMFLEQCGCNEHPALPVRVVLPRDTAGTIRVLLSDIWRENLCECFIKLASVSAYFGIAFTGADNA